jgi:hypothetical protein
MKTAAALTMLMATILGVGSTSALANDSTTELGAGGLNLVRTESVELLSEDLYVSADAVRVVYRFRNKSDAPATYVVAFPLPPVDAGTPEEMNIVFPDNESDDFVDFHVAVDGVPVTAALDQHVTALGVDRTEELRRRGLPLNPIADGLYQRLETLPPVDREEMNRIGLILVDDYSVQTAWRLEQTYYWEQTFPPGRDVVVEHTYRPVVGFGFFGDYVLADDDYRAKYCIDDDFARAARARLAAIAGSMNPYLDERRISYILTTALNWAGPIGEFRLLVDKGDADALVSFCGAGVRKIGPTQFDMTAKDFAPLRELEILIARPHRDE